MLVHSIVVTSDRPRSNVHSLANLSIAKIGQVIRFRAFPQLDLLCLHEIPHVRAYPDVALGAQMGIWADYRLLVDAGSL